MFFIWSHEIIKRGNAKHLDMEDLSDLRKNEEPSQNYDVFKDFFYSILHTKLGRLLISFRKYIGMTFIIGGILAAISNLLQFSGPVMIGRILDFLNSG
jgi:hypothetical protein